ncbi:MAG: hypothetical protein IAE90_07250 [Ignavibacteria bacterium]|nr:hypothetical protein [Ignavibacteria bacterium]
MMTNNNIYKAGSAGYRLKELTLGVMHYAVPLFKKYRQQHFELTCGIDTTELEAKQKEISDLTEALEQLNGAGSSDSAQRTKLAAKLEETKAALESDTKLRTLQKYYSDMEALAMYSLITDKELLREILPEILERAEGKPITPEQAAALLDNAGSIAFVKDAVTDFFSLTLGIMKK